MATKRRLTLSYRIARVVIPLLMLAAIIWAAAKSKMVCISCLF